MSEGGARYEVWARLVRAAIEVAARGGVPAERLTEGLPFDFERLRTMHRVSWDDYTIVVDRMEAQLGGPDALCDLLATGYHQVLPEIRAVAGALLSPKLLTTFVMGTLDPVVFSGVDCQLEDLGVDRVRVTWTLRPGARPCAAWFRGNVGAIRGMPRHLGLDEAKVDAELGDRFGIYDVRLPPSATLMATAGRATRTMLERVFGVGAEDGAAEPPARSDVSLAARGALPPEAVWRLDAATNAWDLTRRQREVLVYLVLGEANKEIAQALSCAENTVELHVTQILRKSKAASRAKLIARFWSEL